MVSGKKQVVWFHACFPASPAASQAACFYFSSIRTGLSCLCRNLSKTNAHWQNSFQSILSKTTILENIFFKTVLFPFTKPVPFQHQYQTKTLRICQLKVNSVLQQHPCLLQSFTKALLVFPATKQDLLGLVYMLLGYC